jgi:pimeloyl-ACP methyl ester carboxylesterase
MAHIETRGIRIEYEMHPAQGAVQRLPVLLIMGLGMQLTAWPEELISALCAAGHPVIRFDNRDSGLSTQMSDAGKPNIVLASMQYAMGWKVSAAYRLADMAADAIALLQALSVPRVHVVGASMGGMIGQWLAIEHAHCVESLTIVMSSSGSRLLPGPTWQARRAMMSRPAHPRSIESVIDHYVHLLSVIGSPGYPADPKVERAYHPHGTMRQLMAIMADGDRSALLPRIRAVTTILHGQDDPLIPVAAANDLARKIAQATLRIIPGMGHDLPAALVPEIAQTILDTTQRAEAAQS